MKYAIFLTHVLNFFISCAQPELNNHPGAADNFSSGISENPLINSTGKNIFLRINLPANYKRAALDSNSFACYLRQFPLKEINSNVYYYNGAEKQNKVHEAILDIDVGKKDLQQCADAVMRLRAEYLYKMKMFGAIHFNFTNGFIANYEKWADGYRIKINGNKTSWYKAAEPSFSYSEFRKYLEAVFSYAGTLSLSRELIPVPIDEIRIGDVFIQGGTPGHAVIVVDIAEESKTGKKIFLIAQSYMPAQDIHILKNLNNPTLSPWYEVDNSNDLFTPEWTFEKTNLMRFGTNE